MGLQAFFDWFAGNGRYRTLFHCMDQDMFWIVVTVTLDVAVATGYALIAFHWWRNERSLPDIPAKRALHQIRNIFIFCGICGYVFIPVKMYWPAWRLYDMFMLFLVYSTWKYALYTRGLSVVYSEIGRNNELTADLEKSREENKRKSFFLNAISHDLRTPLNAMILQSHLADVSAANNDKESLTSAMRDIRASAKASAELLDLLLEYARLDWAIDPLQTSEICLATLVNGVLQGHHAAADAKGLQLRCEVAPDLNVAVDRTKLARVLNNLVSNAVKFTATGGVRVVAESRGPNVEIHVIDTGIGIDPAVGGSLFDEFVQLNNSERDRSKGFGLGLSIAKRLARQWGGDVLLQSAKDSGSRFTVLLPNSRVERQTVMPPAADPAKQLAAVAS